MTCPNCQHDNTTDARFCVNCGAKQVRLCSKCETENEINNKFCKHCGHKLETNSSEKVQKQEIQPKAAERRQLTCLFCDLVGSTALSEQLDAEDFRQVILDYHQIAEQVIKQYGGHVAQYLGDGLLVYFGYPKGLEDAPNAAVRAGLGILEAVASANQQWKAAGNTEIAIRIGIHSGLVVVDDHLALGDTVNIAARLEGFAPINGLVISPQTLKLVQGWFAVKSLGKEVLKGIKEPMEIFQVIKESGASNRIEIAMSRGLSPLVGREEEVYMLLRKWKQAKEGKGQLLLLNGEAGIGKSRLVESLKRQVKQEQKAAKLELRCSDYHVNSPFYPLIDLLEKRILQFEKDESEESKATKLAKWLDFASIDKKPNLPIFADFLSIPIPEELRTQYENPLLAAAGKRNKFIDGFATAFFSFSMSQPLLLIVEDLHWMDSSALEWLNQLVEQINAYPLFVLATTRPQFQATWVNKSYISQLNLTRLNTNRIESICYHQTQGKALPKEILEQIKEKTDGVPLFVEELTRMIIESDLLIEKEARYELNPTYATGFALAVPSTLQDSLIARLDNMSGSKAIAQIGAVIGREFSFEVLQAVVGKEEANLQQDLRQLVAAELLYQRGMGRKASYIFKHALIQDTAYESLLRSKRQQLHQRVVTVLEKQFPELIETEPELLAHHLEEGNLKKEALLMWEKAANKAVDQNASLNAVHHFQKALSLIKYIDKDLEREEKELALLIPCNGVLMVAKSWGHKEVGQNGARILELCETQNNVRLACSGYFGLAVASEAQGKFDNALSYYNKGLVLAKKDTTMDFRPYFNAFIGEINNLLGNFKDSKRYCMQSIQQYRVEKHQFLEQMGAGDTWFHSSMLLSWNLLALGYPDKVKEIVETLSSKTKGTRLIVNLMRINNAKFVFHFWRKEWQVGQKRIKPFLSLAEESGEKGLIPIFQLQNEFLSFLNGSLDSFEKAKDIMYQLNSMNFIFYQSTFQGYLAEGCQVNGMVKEGLDCIKEALNITLKTNEKLYLSKIYQTQGDLMVMDNQPVLAEQAYHQAIAIAQEQSAKWWELLATKSLAHIWQSQGKIAEAYEILHGIYSWFTEGFDTIDMRESKELLEELSTAKEMD